MMVNRFLIYLLILIWGCSLEKRIHQCEILPSEPKLGSNINEFLAKHDSFSIIEPQDFRYFDPTFEASKSKMSNKELILQFKPRYVEIGMPSRNSSDNYDSVIYTFNRGYLIYTDFYVADNKGYPFLIEITDTLTADSTPINVGSVFMIETKDKFIRIYQRTEETIIFTIFNLKISRLLAPTS